MLEIKDLSVSYGDYEVIHNISFHVPEGYNLIILGPNGCGKTTLLRAMAGLMPYQGKVLLKGEEINKLSIKEKSKRIALMSQFSFADFDYTVEQTVLMGRFPYQKTGLFRGTSREDKQIAAQCMELSGLKGMENASVMKLSGGQLQRVFFARALAQSPQMILLDEPTNHLDLRYQAELLKNVKDWTQDHTHMAVGVLHDLNQALRFGDYVVALKEGNIIAEGKIKKILTKNLLYELYDMDVVNYMLESLKQWEGIILE